jgi:predicted amidohydrolase
MKVAAAQLAPVFADVSVNLLRVVEAIQDLGKQGVQFAVFPEAMLTGYCFDTKESALAAAIPSDGPEIAQLVDTVDRSNCAVVIGFAEREGDRLYNTAAILSPGRAPAFYRKTHLPFLGMDRFAERGDSLPVYEAAGARVGVLICFDVRFPEAARALALEGAEILCVPTNWPKQAIVTSNCVCPTRASENQVFLIAADRVGSENGVEFLGYSKIIAPGGRILAAADHDREEILTAEIDLNEARIKDPVVIPNVYELPLFSGRRTELYRALVEERSIPK